VTPSAELSLGQLLAALSERSPAPGAGSAAAWSGALAAALLEMTAAFAGDRDIAARATVLRARLLERGDEDQRSYEPVLAAARLDPGDPSREERLQVALSAACEAPLAIACAASEVAELAVSVAERSKRGLEGDGAAGVLLAEAASRSAAGLVEINLRARSDDPRLAEAARLKRRAAAARERALGD
jgi:formiminotetrahydrofolate cyclodeaminase